MDKINAKKLLVAIEMVLLMDWSQLHYSRDHLSIIIIPPNEIEIHPYSTDIFHYTAGFILQRLFVTKTEKESFRYWFTIFVDYNTMLLDYVIDEGLPTRRSSNIVNSIILFVPTNAFSVSFKLLKQIMFQILRWK